MKNINFTPYDRSCRVVAQYRRDFNAEEGFDKDVVVQVIADMFVWAKAANLSIMEVEDEAIDLYLQGLAPGEKFV